MYYSDGKLFPAGYPVVSGYNHTMVLIPDTLNVHSIILKEQINYLKYRPGKKYKLYYWNNAWKLIAEKFTDEKTTELQFDNVPKNALLLMIPEYTQKKERPFIITDDGLQLWW